MVKVEQDLQTKILLFLNYNLTLLDMYNGLFQFIVSNQKEESISIQRVKGSSCAGPYNVFQAVPSAKKSSNLFDDEGLFGTEEEDPKVDIFNKPPSPVPAKAVPQPEPQVCLLYILRRLSVIFSSNVYFLK